MLCLCRDQYGGDTKVKIITAFSDQDAGRGNAILWLARHFRVFPFEIGGYYGELDLRKISEFLLSPEITLIIQSVPLVEGMPNKVGRDVSWSKNDDSKLYKTDNIKTHIPGLRGINDSFAKISVDLLDKHIYAFSQYLSEYRNENIGPVLYLAGFNLAQNLAHGENLPYSEILPWYLMLCDKNAVRRVYKQPELGKILKELPEENPQLIDLEVVISDMESDPGY